MKLNRLFSPDIYTKIMFADMDKKDDIYRYEMMMPFKGKWDMYHIPMKPTHPGGYDIIMANNRLGLMPPSEIDINYKDSIEALYDEVIWDSCTKA
ncbi:MAG: Zn-dependent protease, partial [Butyrivibrio sp.]|nr:Zn-dependent protease [Butyrivibrio sp.]